MYYPRFMLDAHSDACTVVAHNPVQEGMFLTASHDKTVKLWDSKSGTPKLLGQNNLDVGAVFSASFWADSPFIVAVWTALYGVCIHSMVCTGGWGKWQAKAMGH